jgi:TolA-binding protein
VASASSSSDSEPAPRYRAADAQRRARLDELAEAKRQLDEELAILHQELEMDPEPRDRQPAQDVSVQEQPREGNGERRERRPAADQPRARAPTSQARGRTRDNDRHANEGANANADADTPPLFRRASQNFAAAAMLLRGCPKAVTSKERRVRQQLKALLEAAAHSKWKAPLRASVWSAGG